MRAALSSLSLSFHRQIPLPTYPFVVDLRHDSRHQPLAGGFIRKQPCHTGPPLDLFVQPLDEIHGSYLFPVLSGTAIIRHPFHGVLLEPAAKLRCSLFVFLYRLLHPPLSLLLGDRLKDVSHCLSDFSSQGYARHIGLSILGQMKKTSLPRY